MKTVRCAWCVKYNLTCGTAIHDNPLAVYLPLIATTDLPIPVIPGEDTVPLPKRPPYVPQDYSYTRTYSRKRRFGDWFRARRTWLLLLPLLAAVCALVAACLLAYLALRSPAEPTRWCVDNACTHGVYVPTPSPFPTADE